MNPASKFVLKGNGKSKSNKRIQYWWKAKHCRKDQKDDCSKVDEGSWKSKSTYVNDYDGGTSLIITAGFFKGILIPKS